MMRIRIVQFIIFQTVVLRQAGIFGNPRNLGSNEKEILKASESRYRSDRDYPERDYGNRNNGITRKDFDLPITFKAPHYEAHDYWRNQHRRTYTEEDYHNRRTFFEGFAPGPHGKTTEFPGFYQFMTSIFGGAGEDDTPESVRYNRHRVTPSYAFETPFAFNPTEPNYIPSPKPIRASVIKLETITRSPIYPPFDYETTVKYYPQVGSVLNHVFDGSKSQQSVGYHLERPVPQGKIPPFKPLPVLPKPEFHPQTTTTPIYSGYFNNHTQGPFTYYNNTDYKYPESVQDKLPHLNVGDVEIPYISEKPVPQIFDAYPKEISRERQFGYTTDFFPSSPPRTTTNFLDLIDIRSLNSAGTNTDRQGIPSGRKFKFDATTVKSFPGIVEKVKQPTFKYTKKLTAQLEKSSIERVANLTAQGFSKVENDSSNLRQTVDYLKVRELINHEMDKLQNVSKSRQESAHNVSSARSVNLNDEFSLDAKILKDTNWDGFTVPPTFATTEFQEPTVARNFRPKAKTVTKSPAFWEIMEGQTTVLPFTSEEPTETTTTELINFRTTTEDVLWQTAPDVMEAKELNKTVGPTTPKNWQRRSENFLSRDSFKPVTEEPESIDSATLPETTTPRKRYSRRPKVVNFTPYPTPEELQRKLLTRNHFPKRSKPNITIAFGNKNVIKNIQTLGKEEFMKFSNEEVIKRRKTGKRRQVYKRVRVSTSERPIKDI